MSAGPDRINAAANVNVPAVVAPGCLDMVNFGEKDSVPSEFSDGNFNIYNSPGDFGADNTAGMRRPWGHSCRESEQASGEITIMIPKRAISEINGPGEPFHDAEADEALYSSIPQNAKIEVMEFDEGINSLTFARACAEKLLENITNNKVSKSKQK